MTLNQKAVHDAVVKIVAAAAVKPRKFIETVELQVGLKNYDPKKDPRFNVPLILPVMPKANTSVYVLADAADVGRCEKEKVPCVAFDTLANTYNKDAKMIKHAFKKYDVLLCSKS